MAPRSARGDKTGANLRLLEHHLPIVAGLHQDPVALLELPREQLHRERILDHALDRTLERPRAERRIIAFLGQLLLRLRRELERELAIREKLVEALQLETHDV